MFGRRITIIGLVAFCVSINTLAWATSYVGLPKGTIHRAYVEYKDSDEITVKTGYGECNGDYWEITSETDVNLASVLPSGEDYVYIYIDDSASSYPTPVIVGDLNEPSWSDSKQGWYYGYDRCIGAVWSPSTGQTIQEFVANRDNENFLPDYVKCIASGMNPTGAWQDTTLDCNDYVPVNATHVYVKGWNICMSSPSQVQIRAKDNTASYLSNTSGQYTGNLLIGWLTLGPSRNVQIYGQDDDDNSLALYILAWKIER